MTRIVWEFRLLPWLLDEISAPPAKNVDHLPVRKHLNGKIRAGIELQEDCVKYYPICKQISQEIFILHLLVCRCCVQP